MGTLLHTLFIDGICIFIKFFTTKSVCQNKPIIPTKENKPYFTSIKLVWRYQYKTFFAICKPLKYTYIRSVDILLVVGVSGFVCVAVREWTATNVRLRPAVGGDARPRRI